MKRNELRAAKSCLEKAGKYAGEKFRYAYARNIQLLNAAIKNAETWAQPPAEYITYLREQYDLKMKHAAKDEQGVPKVENNLYVMTDMDAFMSEAVALDEKYKEVRETFAKRQEDIQAFMEEQADITIHKIKESDLPETISAEDFAGIAFMIEGF